MILVTVVTQEMAVEINKLIENVLTSGATFSDKQNLLKYRVKFFNLIIIVSVIFLFFANTNIYITLGESTIPQILVNSTYSLILFTFIFILRKNIKYYLPLMYIQMTLSLVDFASARIFIPEDEFAGIWFFIGQLIAYSIGGNRFGTFYTIASIAINIIIYSTIELSHPNLTIGTFILSSILMAIISAKFNTKIESVEYILIQQNDSLDTNVKEKTHEIELLMNEIELTQREVVFTMGAIGERRSRETGNHVRRVAEYSKILALKYGLDESEADLLKQASPMHDIGKVAIPDNILNKPAKFTDGEFNIMKEHSSLGYEMLQHSERLLLRMASIVAYEHHEKWDGTPLCQHSCPKLMI